jgi:lysophospholipase L1-like esterase
MLADYDSGDHLHPSAAGYKAMGEAIPLSFFQK